MTTVVLPDRSLLTAPLPAPEPRARKEFLLPTTTDQDRDMWTASF